MPCSVPVLNLQFYLILTVITNSDCWPVFDKKQEQQFRKNCSEWIARISKVCVLLEIFVGK